MAKRVSQKTTGTHLAKSNVAGTWAKRQASKQVRSTARTVIVKYRKALRDLEKH